VLPQREPKARYISQLFTKVAHRYDLMNRLASFGRDGAWRREAVRIASPPEHGQALDLGTGTADLAIEIAPTVDTVVALDFCPEMMSRGKAKVAKKGLEQKVNFILGDAEELPFASDSFDCALAGFALRNMTSIARCLAEMRRVVKPGGRVISLELIMPPSRVVRAFHQLYLWRIIPLLGRVVTHDSEAYIYLPRSISDFPRVEEVKAIMEGIGFDEVSYKLLTLGTIAIYSGVK